jgi:hypothetical protein
MPRRWAGVKVVFGVFSVLVHFVSLTEAQRGHNCSSGFKSRVSVPPRKVTSWGKLVSQHRERNVEAQAR